jgi:hypothetical protein
MEIEANRAAVGIRCDTIQRCATCFDTLFLGDLAVNEKQLPSQYNEEFNQLPAYSVRRTQSRH